MADITVYDVSAIEWRDSLHRSRPDAEVVSAILAIRFTGGLEDFAEPARQWRLPRRIACSAAADHGSRRCPNLGGLRRNFG